MTRVAGALTPALVAIVISAMALILWVTPHGLGVNPDSTIYLEAAGNVVAGRGFTAVGQPMVHYPPGYAVLLAAAGVVDPGGMGAARVLHAALFGANTALLGLLIFLAAGRSVVAAVAGMLWCLASRPLLSVHAHMLSEPLFVACGLSALLCAAYHVARPRMPALAGAALFVGAAFMTRYVGAALVPPLIAAAYVAARRAGRSRLVDMGTALMLSCGPMLGWMLRNRLVTGAALNREWAVHPVGRHELESMAVSLHELMLDFPLPGALEAIGVIAAGVLLVAGGYRRARPTAGEGPQAADALIWLALSTGAAYLLFVLVTISLFDATTNADARMVAPAVVLAAPGVAGLLHQAWRRSRSGLRSGAAAWLTAAVAINALGSASWIRETRADGVKHSYSTTAWRASATLAWVKTHAAGVTLYSNDPYAIRFLLRQPAIMIPLPSVPTTTRPNPDFGNELSAMCRAMNRDRAMLVWFDLTGPWFRPTRERLLAECPPLEQRALPDGTIYVAGRP